MKKKSSLVAYVPKKYKEIFKSKYVGFIHAVKERPEFDKYWTVKVKITFEEIKQRKGAKNENSW